MNRPSEFATLLTVAFRNIGRNGRRTTLCVSAIAIAVFVNIFMLAWILGMIDGIERVVTTYETGSLNVVSDRFEQDREYFPVQFPVAEDQDQAALAARLRALPGVTAVLPRITSFATLFDSNVKHALLWGIDIAGEVEAHPLNLTRRSDGLVSGRFPLPGAGECAIGTGLARKTGLKLGDKLALKTVSAQFSDKYWSPTVVGLFEFDYRKFDDGVIVVPLDKLQKILVLGTGVQQLLLITRDAEQAPRLKQAVATLVGPGNRVEAWTDNYWVALFRSYSGVYLIVFAFFQIMASFLIINTVLMVIHERIKEIGMMGALGMTRFEIVAVFFLEALLLSVFGSASGCGFGALVSWIGSLFPLDLEFFTGGGMKEMPISGTIFLLFSPGIIAQGFGFGVLVSAVCVLFPSLRSAFVEPVEALRR